MLQTTFSQFSLTIIDLKVDQWQASPSFELHQTAPIQSQNCSRRFRISTMTQARPSGSTSPFKCRKIVDTTVDVWWNKGSEEKAPMRIECSGKTVEKQVQPRHRSNWVLFFASSSSKSETRLASIIISVVGQMSLSLSVALRGTWSWQ